MQINSIPSQPMSEIQPGVRPTSPPISGNLMCAALTLFEQKRDAVEGKKEHFDAVRDLFVAFLINASKDQGELLEQIRGLKQNPKELNKLLYNDYCDCPEYLSLLKNGLRHLAHDSTGTLYGETVYALTKDDDELSNSKQSLKKLIDKWNGLVDQGLPVSDKKYDEIKNDLILLLSEIVNTYRDEQNKKGFSEFQDPVTVEYLEFLVLCLRLGHPKLYNLNLITLSPVSDKHIETMIAEFDRVPIENILSDKVHEAVNLEYPPTVECLKFLEDPSISTELKIYNANLFINIIFDYRHGIWSSTNNVKLNEFIDYILSLAKPELLDGILFNLISKITESFCHNSSQNMLLCKLLQHPINLSIKYDFTVKYMLRLAQNPIRITDQETIPYFFVLKIISKFSQYKKAEIPGEHVFTCFKTLFSYSDLQTRTSIIELLKLNGEKFDEKFKTSVFKDTHLKTKYDILRQKLLECT